MVWGLVLFFMPLLFGVDPYVENEVYRDENAIAFLVIFAFQCFVASLFGCVGHAALIRATADVYLQLPASKARSYVGVGFRTFCSNLLAGILISLGVFIGLILFILPGIYLGVAWILAHNVIVIEKLGGIGGIGRSFALVRKNWCYVFCVKFIMMVPFGICNKLWIDHVAPFVFTLPGFYVGVIPSMLIAPFVSILVTVIYLNLRIKKEGLDTQALAANLGVPVRDCPDTDSDEDRDDRDLVVGIPDFA